jgi:protein-tyrosine phosphatase
MVDSAGTGDWHIGCPPDERAQHAALSIGGVSIGGLRARQVRPSDFYDFDYVLAMDRSNLANLKAMMPVNATAELALLLDYLPEYVGQSVADPYYGDKQDFIACWQLVDQAAKAFLDALQR